MIFPTSSKIRKTKMSRLIKKLMNVQMFNKQSAPVAEVETGSNSDMDEWKGWDAWVDIKK
jgi:hypothetical protein